ncbi:MAG: hypothetical protein M3Q76_00935 [Acidobacteriota bacterium]|nr:hypothetical protein [Acidobacteriota bacterium]
MMNPTIMNDDRYRERECLHRQQGAEGFFYRGTTYVQSLQRLKSGAALEFSTRVTAFFWSDAHNIVVWLCHDCAGELKLINAESVPSQRPPPPPQFVEAR